MKVYSKEHDYYDTATGGWHTGVHFARPLPILIDTKFTWYHSITERYDYPLVIGFCGKFYTAVQTRYMGKEDTFNYKELDIGTKRFEKYFEKYPYFAVEWLNRRTTIILYPILKDYKFYRIKDAFTAHQEIEMFLTNELASQQDGKDLKETEAQVLQRHGFTKCTFKGKHTGRKLKRR